MSTNPRWLILFLGINLRCDSPILEAIFSVVDTNIWQYLCEDYSIDNPIEPLLEIIKKNDNWRIITFTTMDGRRHLQFESRDSSSKCTVLEPHNNTISFYAHNLNNGYYFALQFYKGKCNAAHIGIQMKIAKNFLSEISLIPNMKHQLLKARQILAEYAIPEK